MMQILFRIPVYTSFTPEGIPVYGFGMMLFIAFIVCTWLAGKRAVAKGIEAQIVHDLSVWIFVAGLLGARTLFLYEQKLTLTEFLMNFPRIWDGGIILYGSVLGGTLGFFAYWFMVLRPKRIEPLLVIDILAPSVALGIAIGRIGCLMNGCCFGQIVEPSQPAIAIHFPLSAPARYDLVRAGLQTAAGFTFSENQKGQGAVVGKVEPDSAAKKLGISEGDIIIEAEGQMVKNPFDLGMILNNDWPRGKKTLQLKIQGKQELILQPHGLGLHPAQLYETMSMALLLFFLLSFEPFQTRVGQLTALLMMCYAMHRFLNELLRSDPRPVSLESNVSLFLFLAGALLLAWLQWKGTRISNTNTAVAAG